ncbi:FecR family protein [Chryseobacterium polytrichastri]|uniref:FecR family protein n=1 Tax=Chryseobacterium polytrichastri TaxID=1302687 RepID=A0A1M7DM91_9FLAO|nr:FecR domain-containing protein [Chryseobacterium polytrichastri]SHL80575.1 FecR family protein [Chryseobacterium polytrichastri]
MENQDHLQQLLEKYKDHRCSPEEVKHLLKYFHKESEEQDQLMELVLAHLEEMPSPEELDNRNFDSVLDRAYLTIQHEIEQSDARSKAGRLLWKKVLAAATIIITSTIGISTFYYINKNKTHSNHPLYAQDILPGGHKATLTLADGKTLSLSDTHSGIIISDTSISYSDGTRIFNTKNSGLISISTPRGGEYGVVLSDGSKVWLNAATTLQYSADLMVRGKRKVMLVDGEAYFEVAKDKKHPFVVSTRTQEVEVLGTHFNINSYADQGRTVTTLEEGSVKVSSLHQKTSDPEQEVLLKPCQQSFSAGGKLSVHEADLSTALAWRNGLMKFKDRDLKSVLREASRWYDIEVEYHGGPTAELFTGGISRTESLEGLLEVLRLSGIRFKVIEDDHHRKLIVNP